MGQELRRAKSLEAVLPHTAAQAVHCTSAWEAIHIDHPCHYAKGNPGWQIKGKEGSSL